MGNKTIKETPEGASGFKKILAFIIMVGEVLSTYVFVVSRKEILIPLAATHLVVASLLFWQYWFKGN